MRNRVRPVILLICLIAIPAITFADGSAESVMAKIAKQWDKVKAYTATVETQTNITVGGSEGNSTATGTLECLKEGDTVKFRIQNSMKTTVVGKTLEQKMLSVSDGSAVFTEVNMGGKISVMKMSPDANMSAIPVTGKGLFEQMKSAFTINVLPEETVNGVKCYVLELTPKETPEPPNVPNPQDIMPGKNKAYFSQDSGLQVQMIMFNQAGKPITTMQYKDIDFKAKIDPSRFTYSPPPGVKVMDMTEMMKSQKGQGK